VLLGSVGRALRSGRITAGRAVDVHEELRSFEVTSATPFPYQVDGDHLGDTRLLAFRHEPDVLSLILP
jgi:hypothetical protein